MIHVNLPRYHTSPHELIFDGVDIDRAGSNRLYIPPDTVRKLIIDEHITCILS